MNKIWLEKFEDYLQNKMKAGDKLEFEAQLASDKEMQNAFSLFRTIETDMRYLSASEEDTVALRSTLENLNDKYINSKATGSGKTRPFVPRKRKIFYTGIAAALVLIIVSYAVFLGSGPGNMHKTANDYFAANFQQLGQTMGSDRDSMQLGIAAYNQGNYALAQTYFEGLLDEQPANAEALKNLGLSHLSKEEFDHALKCFDQLAKRNDLMSNPGQFLKALTLLIRNDPGDLESAHTSLKQVVELQSEGHEEAEEWIKGMD